MRPQEDRDDPEEESGIPFGAQGWKRAPGMLREDPDSAPDEETEGQPGRRRKPEGPTHPRRTVAALGGAVEVVRDASGIPHVFAKKERDAYAALGFCMAEDRLFQMDLYRRVATGRSAELLGAVTARHDALVRTAGVARRAAAAATRVDGVGRDLLAAFAGGVNAARGTVQPEECARLGYQIEPWTIADSLAIELYLAWTMSLATWPDKLLLARIISTQGLERARWISPGSVDASLATDDRMKVWRRIDLRVLADIGGHCTSSPVGTAVAIGPSRSSSGAALLACDLQLPLGLPSPMYLARLEAPGFSAVGAAHVGIPALWMGRSEHCAWSGTGAVVDDSDCVLEELDGIGNFRTESGWAKLNRRHEVVRVRDGDSLRFAVEETRNGPLFSSLVDQLDGVSGSKPVPFAVRWGVNSLGTSVAGWLAVARARNLGEIGTAAGLLDRASQTIHLVAADTSGAVGHLSAGSRPVRDGSARLPVRGWKSEGRWTAAAPLSRAGWRREGDCALSADQRVLEGSADRPSNDSASECYRLRRIRELLEAGSIKTADALSDAQMDVLDRAAADLLPCMQRAGAGQDVSGTEQIARARGLLETWDARADASSSAAAVFYVAMLSHLLPALFPEARFGSLARRFALAWPAASRILAAESSPWFPERGAADALIARALGDAVDQLSRDAGPDSASWTWGMIHPATLARALETEEWSSTSPWPAPGSPFTLFGQSFSKTTPPFTVAAGPAARMVVDLAERDVRLGIASGESGDRQSANCLDQVEPFRSGKLLTLPAGTRPTGTTIELVPG